MVTKTSVYKYWQQLFIHWALITRNKGARPRSPCPQSTFCVRHKGNFSSCALDTNLFRWRLLLASALSPSYTHRHTHYNVTFIITGNELFVSLKCFGSVSIIYHIMSFCCSNRCWLQTMCLLQTHISCSKKLFTTYCTLNSSWSAL